MMLPMTSTKGLIFIFTTGGSGSAATNVKYLTLTDAAKKIESGKYYRLNLDMFNTAPLINSSTTASTSMSSFWYCKGDPSTSYLNSLLKSSLTPSNITILIDGFTSTPAALSNCTKLETFIDNECTALPESMFSGCTGLKNVSLNSIKLLSVNAFENCSSLTKLVLNSWTNSTLTFDDATSTTCGPFGKDNSITQNIDLFVNSSIGNISGNNITLKYSNGAMDMKKTYTFKSITVI